DGDGAAVHHQALPGGGHGAGKMAVGGVVAGEVANGVQVRQLVDGHHLQLPTQAPLVERPEHRAPHPTKAIDGKFQAQFSTVSRAATTLSSVMPKYLYRSPAGAEAPKPVMPTTAPSRPTYFCQKSTWPASTATRARTAGGSTVSR